MDELKDLWKSIRKDTDDFTAISEDEIKSTINKKSIGIMEKLKNGVLKKIYFCGFFMLVIGIYIPFASPLPSQILLLVLFAAYLVGLILLVQEYRELKEDVDTDSVVVSGLKKFRDRIKRVLKYEERVGLFIYPISLTAGFMVGMQLGAEDGSYMTETRDWVALLITMAIIIPLADWLARWMNKKAFGSYLDRLEANIKELETEEK